MVRDESIVSGLELRGVNDLAKRRGLYSVLTRRGRINKEKRWEPSAQICPYSVGLCVFVAVPGALLLWI